MYIVAQFMLVIVVYCVVLVDGVLVGFCFSLVMSVWCIVLRDAAALSCNTFVCHVFSWQNVFL